VCRETLGNEYTDIHDSCIKKKRERGLDVAVPSVQLLNFRISIFP